MSSILLESLIDVLLTQKKLFSQDGTAARTKVYRKLLGDHKRLSDIHRATLGDLQVAKGEYQSKIQPLHRINCALTLLLLQMEQRSILMGC